MARPCSARTRRALELMFGVRCCSQKVTHSTDARAKTMPAVSVRSISGRADRVMPEIRAAQLR